MPPSTSRKSSTSTRSSTSGSSSSRSSGSSGSPAGATSSRRALSVTIGRGQNASRKIVNADSTKRVMLEHLPQDLAVKELREIIMETAKPLNVYRVMGTTNAYVKVKSNVEAKNLVKVMNGKKLWDGYPPIKANLNMYMTPPRNKRSKAGNGGTSFPDSRMARRPTNVSTNAMMTMNPCPPTMMSNNNCQIYINVQDGRLQPPSCQVPRHHPFPFGYRNPF